MDTYVWVVLAFMDTNPLGDRLGKVREQTDPGIHDNMVDRLELITRV